MTETKATIIRRKSLTHNVIEFTLETETPLSYTPGQFFMLKLQTPEGQVQYRSYSIAHTSHSSQLGMVIKLIDGGLASEYMRHKKSGDEIIIRGASGIFTFTSKEAPVVHMLCTGTGIVPLLAMITSQLAEGNISQLYLYFGNRYRVDIFWDDVLEELKTQYPNFDYTIILSKPDAMWHGQKGYVTGLISAAMQPDHHYYLCGLPEMIEEAKQQLFNQGVPKEHIFEEKYTSVGELLKKRQTIA